MSHEPYPHDPELTAAETALRSPMPVMVQKHAPFRVYGSRLRASSMRETEPAG
jgi:hypothetical protein